VSHAVSPGDMFRGMYWPLIAGFIAFLLLLILIGWAVDRSAAKDPKAH
jgi:hypothetical protein